MPNEQTAKLSREQVQSVLNFAESLYIAEKYGSGYFSPWMSNQLMNNLNNSPKPFTMQELKKALKSYKDNASTLQDYTEFMKRWDMIFARTLKSYANVLAFDLQVVCTNAFTDDDFKSDEYQKDKQRINQFLNSFDYKAEFGRVVEQLMTTEVGYYWFRKTKWGNKGMKCTLQLMPQDRCMLTGYWEKGLLYDFDMTYFLNPGVDIDGYDPAFKKYYNRVFGESKGVNDYRPTNVLNARNGTYAMWTQTSPEDGAWSFKLDMSNFNATPFLAPFLKSALLDGEIEELQYNKDIASAYAILAGDIRLFDNAKSGTKADQFAIDPSTLGVFMGKVKAGLPEQIKGVAMPTENTKMYQYTNSNPDMYDSRLKNTAGTGGGISRVIYSSDRMSNAEIQYAAEQQYNIMKPLYSQFQNFLNFFANKLTKKYKFKFIFDGCSYSFDREKRFDRLLKLADKGIVLNSSAYASVLGMTPPDFEQSLAEGHAGGMIDKLTMLLNANTMKDGGTGGRPRQEASQLTDSGEQSREGLE